MIIKQTKKTNLILSITSNFLSSSLATVYNTPDEFGRAAVLSEVASHPSKCEKSSKNFCHSRHVSSILKEELIINNKCEINCFSSIIWSSYLSLLSMDKAQMLLQRRSRLRVACWMESHSASVAQASQSCRSTSHRFSTEATPVLCFSMSR